MSSDYRSCGVQKTCLAYKDKQCIGAYQEMFGIYATVPGKAKDSGPSECAITENLNLRKKESKLLRNIAFKVGVSI